MATRVINVSELLGPGVYVLSNRGHVNYVGCARVMLVALAQWAMRNKNPAIPKWFPIRGVVFDTIEIIPCDPDTAKGLAKDLIAELDPLHNRSQHPGQILPPVPLPERLLQ